MNPQRFELLILGSSAATPTSERNSSAQLLNIAERHFLIDCGEATQIQLRKFKAKFQAIDHILISHMHGDHFFGLPGLLSSMHLLGRKQGLTIYCPEPMKEIMDLINRSSETVFNYPITWKFTGSEPELLFEDDKVEVRSFPLKHRIFCTGFLFREKPLLRNIRKEKLEEYRISTADMLNIKKGHDVYDADNKLVKNADLTFDPPPSRSYAYCSDTMYSEEIVKHIRGVDLLYHESTFLEDNLERAKKTYHSTARQAAEIARMAEVKKLLLGHFSVRYGELEEFLKEARTTFNNCEVCEDGKILKI